MKKRTTILIVEDDMIIGANLSLQLTKLGYEITGILSRGEEAVDHVLKNAPDILLLDINLKGTLSGIDTATSIQQFMDIPVIYLTANSDAKTFEKAKATHPRAFITKPFNKLNLQRTVALVEERLKEEGKEAQVVTGMHVLNDRIFIRHNSMMEKLLLADILYVEADRNYATVVTASKKYLLSSTLKVLEEKLPKAIFLRIHRSYMVNVFKLDVVGDSHIEIDRKVIPISRSHKNELMGRIQTL